jgi:hypothetical protein
MPRWTDDELFSHRHGAIERSRPGLAGEDRDEVYPRIVGEQILAPLKLSNWKFERYRRRRTTARNRIGKTDVISTWRE